MANPLLNSPALTAGEPNLPTEAPYAKSGKVQPKSPHGPKLKTITVKAHTRTVKAKAPKVPKSNGGTPAPVDPNAALLNAAVRLRFGGQEAALGQQLNQNARFATGVPAWYAQAVDAIKAQQVQAPQSAMPAPTGDPAQDSRNAAAYGFQQQRANAIGAGNQFLTNVGAGLQVAQGNQLGQANLQRQNLLSQQGQLKAQEGAYKTSVTADQQAAQSKAEMDQAKLNASLAIASGKLDLAKTILTDVTKPKTQAQIKVSKQNAATQRANQRESARQNKVKNALDVGKQAEKALVDSQKLADKGNPKVKPITPAVKNKATTDWQGAQAMIRNVYGKKHFRPEDVADQLSTSKHSIDRDVALAAAQMVKNARQGIQGIDDPKLAKRLKARFGLRVPVVHQSPVIGGALGNVLGALTAGEPN